MVARTMWWPMVLMVAVACADGASKDDTTGDSDTEDSDDTDTDTDDTIEDTDTDTDGDTDDTDVVVADIEIAGSWVDNFGSTHEITNTGWASYGGDPTVLTQYDNDADFAVGQNPSSDKFNADLWSRYDWFTDGSGQLWYCQTTFNAKTEQAALDTPPADSSGDLSKAGCGTFGWSQLLEPTATK